MAHPGRHFGTFPCGKLSLAVLSVVLVITGCADDDGPLYVKLPPGSAGGVLQSSIAVDGSVAPPNPVNGAETPAELNRALAQVYRRDGVADADVENVLILIPGFLGGAGTFDYMARRIVERTDGDTVVWAVDRRSNALEDQTGFDAAEAAGNPDVAKDYYFNGAEIGGKTFAGFLESDDVSFESEWGVAVHMQDFDALVSAAAERYPQAHLFLGGHSLGVSLTAIYAAWDFGDHAGFERLSGVVLLEGAPNPRSTGEVPDQLRYERGGRSSLEGLRRGNPVSGLDPFLTTEIYATAEIVAMRASGLFGDPEGLSPDEDIAGGFFSSLLGVTEVPEMTKQAAFGFGFDDDFEPLSFARASIGDAVGPIGPNPNGPLLEAILGVTDPLFSPTDPSATYSWESRRKGDTDPTDIETFARLMFAGPSNFIEWYFPARLTLDAGVAGWLNVQPQGDWRKEAYGMAVTENGRMDLPVFAVAGSRGLVPDVAEFDPYRESVAAVLRNGVPRGEDSSGFVTVLGEDHVHLDVLTADDAGDGNGVFAPLVDWMRDAARVAPRQPPA